MKEKSLTKYIYLSILAAFATITLKTIAFLLTGSVGLLSDALESVVNLFAAFMALMMLTLSEKPPDEDHLYGHSKAEYFSSIVEGILIIIAAIAIGITAINRLIYPQIIEKVSLGLAISFLASLINFTVGAILIHTGKKHRSIILEADGHHLMTDVWTSAGVIVAVGLVSITNIQILDPTIALFVAANIIITGTKIMKRSALGLMDTSLPKKDLVTIKQILDKYCRNGIHYHGLRTRQSASRRFLSVHLLVPRNWSVQTGHDLSENIESEICRTFSKITVTTHLEPIGDPKSENDITIDRKL